MRCQQQPDYQQQNMGGKGRGSRSGGSEKEGQQGAAAGAGAAISASSSSSSSRRRQQHCCPRLTPSAAAVSCASLLVRVYTMVGCSSPWAAVVRVCVGAGSRGQGQGGRRQGRRQVSKQDRQHWAGLCLVVQRHVQQWNKRRSPEAGGFSRQQHPPPPWAPASRQAVAAMASPRTVHPPAHPPATHPAIHHPPTRSQQLRKVLCQLGLLAAHAEVQVAALKRHDPPVWERCVCSGGGDVDGVNADVFEVRRCTARQQCRQAQGCSRRHTAGSCKSRPARRPTTLPPHPHPHSLAGVELEAQVGGNVGPHLGQRQRV